GGSCQRAAPYPSGRRLPPRSRCEAQPRNPCLSYNPYSMGLRIPFMVSAPSAPPAPSGPATQAHPEREALKTQRLTPATQFTLLVGVALLLGTLVLGSGLAWLLQLHLES